MNLKNTLAVLAVLGVFVLVGPYILRPTPQPVGGASGPEHTEQQSFLAGYVVGTPSVPGTAITARFCSTASRSFNSLATSGNPFAYGGSTGSGTSTAVTVAYAALGDFCEVSFASSALPIAYAGLRFGCDITGASTSIVWVQNLSSTAVTVGTSTLTVCATRN